MADVEMRPMGATASRPPPGQGTILSSPWGNVSLAGYQHRKGHAKPGNHRAAGGQSALHVPDLSLVDSGEWHKDLARAHYVVVVTAENKEWLEEEFMPRIALAGLRAIAFWDSGQENVIVKIFAPLDRLLYEADRIDKRLEVDSRLLRLEDVRKNVKLQRAGLQFDPTTTAALFEEDLAIPDEEIYKGAGRYEPYSHIYAAYRHPDTPAERRVAKLFKVDEYTNCILDNKTCIQLLHTIIHAPTSVGGAGWDLERLQLSKSKRVSKFFPSHFFEMKEDLRKRWYVWCSWPWNTPLNEIRRYLGEEVGMYFSFLSFLTMALLIPAALGLATFMSQQLLQELHLVWLPGIAIATALFAALFMEGWKRQQSSNAMEWGMTNFEKEESLRAAFMTSNEVLHKRSLVHGKPEYWTSLLRQRMKKSFSLSLVFTAIGAVVAAVVGLFFVRIVLTDLEEDGDLPGGFGGIIASLLTAIQIQIMSFLYKSMASWLNEFENHATETQFRDALTLKRAVFEAVNSYFSLFWIVLKATGDLSILGHPQVCAEYEGEPDCLHELQSTIMVIFITRLVVGNFQEIALPVIIRFVKRCLAKCKRHDADAPHGPPSQAELDAEKELPDVFEDYMEILITYGYCVLFVVAFPLSPLLAMVSFYIELRVDALKFLDGSTRPIPRGAQDIGTWQMMFDSFGMLAVISNLVLVIFTENNFLGFTFTMDRVVALFFVEHGLFVIKGIVDAAIPDSPAAVSLQEERQEYLVDKHFNGVEDEILTVAGIQAQDAEDAGELDGRTSRNDGGAPRSNLVDPDADVEEGLDGNKAALQAALKRSWVRQMLFGWKIASFENDVISSLPVWGAFGPEFQDLSALEREATGRGEFVPSHFTGAGAGGKGTRSELPEETAAKERSASAVLPGSDGKAASGQSREERVRFASQAPEPPKVHKGLTVASPNVRLNPGGNTQNAGFFANAALLGSGNKDEFSDSD